MTPDGLKIASLNVCGLQSKLMFPEFTEFIEEYDLICLSETKLDDVDQCDVPGYTFFNKNRDRCKRKSGGIGVFVKGPHT